MGKQFLSGSQFPREFLAAFFSTYKTGAAAAAAAAAAAVLWYVGAPLTRPS